jgi:hypothetical protein
VAGDCLPLGKPNEVSLDGIFGEVDVTRDAARPADLQQMATAGARSRRLAVHEEDRELLQWVRHGR